MWTAGHRNMWVIHCHLHGWGIKNIILVWLKKQFKAKLEEYRSWDSDVLPGGKLENGNQG